MNDYKVGQIYRVGCKATMANMGDIIEITKVDNDGIRCENIYTLSKFYGEKGRFTEMSVFDETLELIYDPNEKLKTDDTKSCNVEITIGINKTGATATLEIDGIHKETIDGEGYDVEDFIYGVIDVFVERINNPDALYNGKVVCIDPCACEDMYTLGKIYEFKDGRILDDDGCVVPPIDEEDIADFVEWQEFSSAKWVEVVE